MFIEIGIIYSFFQQQLQSVDVMEGTWTILHIHIIRRGWVRIRFVGDSAFSYPVDSVLCCAVLCVCVVLCLYCVALCYVV